MSSRVSPVTPRTVHQPTTGGAQAPDPAFTGQVPGFPVPGVETSKRVRLVEAALVVALALGTRLIYFDHVPHKDELNHVLGAHSLLVNGTLEIVPGAVPYDRAWIFTYLVAGMFRLFGESLVVARLPALIAGIALVLALFLWVRSEAGRVAAWVSALLLIFSPIAIQLSQWTRFYTIHALLFFLACWLVYRVFATPRSGPRFVAAHLGAAALALALAFHLQVTTVVGIGGLLLWVALMSLPRLSRRFPQPRQRMWLAAGVLAVAVLGGALLVLSGVAEWAIARATGTDLWAEENRDNIRYYHYILLEQYPPLWSLFPLAVLLAAASRFRAALLCTCVFGVAFVVHSLMAWKDERYLFYALPMFFALWGIAVGGSLPWLRERFHVLWSRVTVRGLPRRAESAVFATFLVGVAGFAAVGSAATSYSLKMLTVGDAEWRWGGYRGNPDWVAAASVLGPRVRKADVVLASYDITALYGLGRVDYLFRRARGGSGQMPEFGLSGKTRVPIISTPESLAKVMSCNVSGLVVIERTHWRKEVFVTPAAVDYLEAHTAPIPLPDGWRLYAYSWTGRGEQAGSERCSSLLPWAE